MVDNQNFEKDINVPSKEQIIIDGVTYYKQQDINEGLDEEHYITEFHLLATHYNLLLEDYARKTRECEELKAYAQRQENQREEYYKEFLKKDKALEEIEKVCLEDTYTFADGTAVRYDSLDDILNIIKKVKENNEDRK